MATVPIEEFRINQFIDYSQFEPSATGLVGGGYVVTWQSQYQEAIQLGGGWDYGIYGQVYGPSGFPMGDEFLVNTYRGGHQYYPSVGALEDGGFVVTWRDDSSHSGGSGYDVRGQRYNGLGAAVGEEFRVNTEVSGNQYEPVAAGIKGGGFVVAWRDDSGGSHDSGSGYDVWARVFNADGMEAVAEFRVNKTQKSGNQYWPTVAGLKDGGFVVAWRNDQGSHNDGTGAGSGYDVWARVMNADGTEAVEEFRVNTDQFSGNQYEPTVSALSGGGFVVAWRNDQGSHDDGTGAGSGYDVWARAFDADGTQITGEFRVNTYTGGHQYEPTVGGLEGGGFVVAWRDDNGNSGSRGGSSQDVFGQRYDADGTAVGDEFLVNTYISSSQYHPSIATLKDGGFVVSWFGYGNGDSSGIYGQRYDAQGNKGMVRLVGSGLDDEVTQATAAQNLVVDLGDRTDSITFGDNADSATLINVEKAQMGGGNDVVYVGGSGPANQVDVITLPTQLSDAYKVKVNDVSVTYTAQAGDTMADIRAGLIGAINADTAMSNLVAASGGTGAGELKLKAQSSSVGPEFRVNTYTTSQQYEPSITALSGGRFVATWTSSGQDGNGTGIYGQISNARGEALGGEFLVNLPYSQVGGSGQYHSSVATLADGGFVVTWYDDTAHNDGGSGSDIYGRRYDANGQVVGKEFRVNTYVSSYQYHPDVASLSGGGFVITWRDDSGTGGSGYEVRGQVYDVQGEPLGHSFGVNSYKNDYQYQVDVAGLNGGGFVVTWTSQNQDGSGYGIYGQRYDRKGTRLGGEFRVNTWTNSSQHQSSISSLKDGGFVVTWNDSSGHDGGSSSDIRGQRYDASGAVVGTEFRVNTYTPGSQEWPAVSGLKDGGFVVAWQDSNGSSHDSGEGYDVWTRTFDAAGNTAGDEYRVNTHVSGSQDIPSVAALDDGGFVVIWESDGQDGDSTGIYARYFRANGDPVSFTSSLQRLDVSGSRVELVRLFGTIEAGDSYTVSVNGQSATYTAQAGDNLADVRQGLVNIINATLSSVVKASAGDDVDELTLSEAVEGTSFTVTAGATNGGSVANNMALSFTEQSQSSVVGTVQGVITVSSATLAGADIDGGAGADTLYGNKGADTLRGGDGNDTLVGAGGIDVLVGGAGNDVLVGGAGADVALYSGNADGYAIDIANAKVSDIESTGGDEGTDTLSGVESIRFGDGSQVGFAGHPEWGYWKDSSNWTTVSGNEEFPVNTHTEYDQQWPTVAGLADGGYVVTWGSYKQDNGTNDYGIYAQRYDAGGTALGDEFRVNTWTQAEQQFPRIAVLDNGNFVITWMDSSAHDGGSGWDVRARVYSGAGIVLGDEFRVNTYFSSTQYYPDITSLEDGGFVVVWEDHGSGSHGGSGHDIWAQRYGAGGDPVGSEFLVNAEVKSGQQYQASVTGLVGGGFVVNWMDDSGGDTAGHPARVGGKIDDIWARVYNADGSVAVSDFRMNTTTDSDQQRPTVTGLANGGFAAAWE